MTDQEEQSAGAEAPVVDITFSIKSSSDQKHIVTVPDSTTVQQLKQKLSTSEFADIPPERQRLIYSGRVLKDPDTLASYKIKDGNTVHLVKGAANTSRPATESPASSSSPHANGVPQNIAAGTGNDPLAGLTGARYAGFAQMPGAGMFGPDGGMGPPQNPEDLLRMLENPMFQSQMNEAMNNPQVIQMMQNNPMMRDQPMMREMLNNPDMRRMMMDPSVIRASLQMQQMMGGRGGNMGSGGAGMPMPGVTDTTEGAQHQQQQQQNESQTSPPPNPFAGMMGGGMGSGAAGNPFAALFGGGMNPTMNPPPADPQNTTTNNSAASNVSTTPQTASQSNQDTTQDASRNQQQTQPNPFNPFASVFGAPATGLDSRQAEDNPLSRITQQMMQNPEMMRGMMNMMGGGAGAGAGAGGHNPFSYLANPNIGADASAQGGTQQQDTRPPEEIYAEQIRQLNDMGFFEFERNVRALRMSGGRVEGAVELLLNGTV